MKQSKNLKLRESDHDLVKAIEVVTDVGNSANLIVASALRHAVDNCASFASIATDAKGVIQIFNLGAERLLGYPAQEMLNKLSPVDIFDPQEIIEHANALSEELGLPISILPSFEVLVYKAARGIEDIYELTFLRKNGTRFPAVVSVKALYDAQHAILGYLFIGTDNCARKQAEAALHKAGALQNAIFNSANFSSIATDAKGVIQIFNVGAERMLGYAAADVVNKITPADLSDPQELIDRGKALSEELDTQIAPGFEALVFKASRGIEDIYELTYLRKDGSRLPAVVSVTALRDDQDQVIGYLLIGTDNTERKQIEARRNELDQRLRDQQFYTRSLIEASIDAVMTTDPSGIITDVNNQMAELTGCTRDELLGAPFKKFFTDPMRAEAGIKLVLVKKKVLNYELTAMARDGKLTDVSYNATTFYDRDRRLQGVFATARDITDRKQAERQILALALHDTLTGLPNRRLLNERLGQTMATDKRSGCYSALMFMDVDKFKQLNDTQGHYVGDLLLIEMARRIQNCVREIDVVARFGGDEFVVILSELDVDRESATALSLIVAEKLRASLSKMYRLVSKREDQSEVTIEYRSTASIGVVVFKAGEGSRDDLLRWADTAMYQAKEAGGNSLQFFVPELTAPLPAPTNGEPAPVSV